MAVANLLITLVGAYVAMGVMFAIAFVARGITRVDPGAKGSTTGFKVIVFPGTVALWPLLLARWVASWRGHP